MKDIKEIIEKYEEELAKLEIKIKVIKRDIEMEKIETVENICKLKGLISFRNIKEFDRYIEKTDIKTTYPIIWLLTDAVKETMRISQYKEKPLYEIGIIHNRKVNLFETLNKALEWLKDI